MSKLSVIERLSPKVRVRKQKKQSVFFLGKKFKSFQDYTNTWLDKVKEKLPDSINLEG